MTPSETAAEPPVTPDPPYPPGMEAIAVPELHGAADHQATEPRILRVAPPQAADRSIHRGDAG